MDIRSGKLSGKCKACGAKGNRSGCGPRRWLNHDLARQLYGSTGNHSRFYNIWVALHQRCENDRAEAWPNYGGRGITVCERWADFANFVDDMYATYSPELTVDREDNDGPYSPENCRWVTRIVQCNNNRRNHLLTHEDRTMSIADWAREVGMPYARLKGRIQRGWPVERALSV